MPTLHRFCLPCATILASLAAVPSDVLAQSFFERVVGDVGRVGSDLSGSPTTAYTARIGGFSFDLNSSVPFDVIADGDAPDVVTGTINGVPLSVAHSEDGESAHTVVTLNDSVIYDQDDDHEPGNSYSFRANGHSFTLASVVPIDDLDDDSPVTLTIDGVVTYSGSVRNIDEVSTLQFLQKSGLLPAEIDGTQRVVQSSSRSVTSVMTRRITSLVQPSKFQLRHDKEREREDSAAGTGLAAGDGGGRFAVWSTGAYSYLSGDSRLTTYTGHGSILTVGADCTFDDAAVVGLSLVRFQSRLSLIGNRSLRTTGIGLVPYAGASFLDQTVSVSANAGIFRTDTESHALLTSSSFDGHRVMASLNASYAFRDDAFSIGPTLGLLYTYNMGQSHITTSGQRVDRTDTWVADVSAGVQASYALSDAVEIGGSISYIRDLVPTFSQNALVRQTDKDLMEAGVRVTWYRDGALTASTEASHAFLTNEQKASTVVASLRYSF